MRIIGKIAAWLGNKIGVRGDYVLHFVVCFLSSLTSYEGGWAAFGASLAAEYKDSITPGKFWSWWDLFADAIGIASGFIFRKLIENYL